MEPKCNVTLRNNNKTSVLTINDVQLNDTGLYSCHECRDHHVSEAQLAVVGKPKCDDKLQIYFISQLPVVIPANVSTLRKLNKFPTTRLSTSDCRISLVYFFVSESCYTL